MNSFFFIFRNSAKFSRTNLRTEQRTDRQTNVEVEIVIQIQKLYNATQFKRIRLKKSAPLTFETDGSQHGNISATMSKYRTKWCRGSQNKGEKLRQYVPDEKSKTLIFWLDHEVQYVWRLYNFFFQNHYSCKGERKVEDLPLFQTIPKGSGF